MSLTPWAEQRERLNEHTLGAKTNRQLSLGEALTLGCVAYRLRFSGGCATGSFEASGTRRSWAVEARVKMTGRTGILPAMRKEGVNCL
jgi:hypothetical protein